MSPAWTLPLVLFSAPEPPDRFELREEYARIMRITAARNHPDPLQLAPELCGLYLDIGECPDMAGSERAAKRRSVKSRLERFRDKLALTIVRKERELQRQARRGREQPRRRSDSQPVPREQAQAAAGNEIQNARALIELIETTIAPESWQSAGGLGSISYYRPLKVLVIRNTAEVHGQLGGALQQLRR